MIKGKIQAGWGTSPMVHASANTDHPIKQGLMGAFEVFMDTIVVCSLTGLVVIQIGFWNSGLQGSELTLTAFESGMGYIGRVLIAIAIFLFGLIFMISIKDFGISHKIKILLSNESFVAKAPQKVVDEEKAKGEKYKDMLKQIEERISQMTK